MNFVEIIKCDLYRYSGNISIKNFFLYFIINYAFRYIIYYRIGHHLFLTQNKLTKVYQFFFNKIKWKYHIDISLKTKIGYGFYIGHPFSIAVSKYAIIGENVNISQNVTIGAKQVGTLKGAPKIGNNVYIGPGAVVIGKIVVGNNVVIGANSVVIRDVPDNAVVAGVPAKILSYDGSEGIVNNKWIV